MFRSDILLKNGLQVPKCRKACYFIFNMNLFVTSLAFMVIVNFTVYTNSILIKLAVVACCVTFTSQVKNKNNVKQIKLFNLTMVL